MADPLSQFPEFAVFQVIDGFSLTSKMEKEVVTDIEQFRTNRREAAKDATLSKMFNNKKRRQIPVVGRNFQSAGCRSGPPTYDHNEWTEIGR